MQITSLSGLSTPSPINLVDIGFSPQQVAVDLSVGEGFIKATETDLMPSSAPLGLTSFFDENTVTLVKQGASTINSSLEPVWQGWAQFVGLVYNLTSTQVAGVMIFGIAAGSVLGLYATHMEKSEVGLVRELESLERDLGAHRIFDLVALRNSSIQNLDELKQALQAYRLATERLKLYQSERADIHDWMAAPKGRGPNEGVVTMRITYGRIVRALETKIRSFLIYLAMTNTSDSPAGQQGQFVREYGEFIRITGIETAGNTHYAFRQEMGWLKQRYEDCLIRQERDL